MNYNFENINLVRNVFLEEKKEHGYSVYLNTTIKFILHESKGTIIYNHDGTFNRVKINENIFANISEKDLNKEIKKEVKKQIGNAYTIIESGQKVYIDLVCAKEYTYSKSFRFISCTSKISKGEASQVLKEIIENATNRSFSPNHKKSHNSNGKYGFYKYDTFFSIIKNDKELVFNGKVLIRNSSDGKKYLYDIISIKRKN